MRDVIASFSVFSCPVVMPCDVVSWCVVLCFGFNNMIFKFGAVAMLGGSHDDRPASVAYDLLSVSLHQPKLWPSPSEARYARCMQWPRANKPNQIARPYLEFSTLAVLVTPQP